MESPKTEPVSKTETKVDTTIFRTQVKPQEAKEEVNTPRSTDIPDFSPEYSKPPIEAEPYIETLWELGEEKEHFEMPSLLTEINEFVLSEIERNKMDKNHEAYEEVLNNYLKRLKLPDNVDIYTKTERVAELMRIDKKLLDNLRDKEALMNADPTKLNSNQLKKYIESRTNGDI